MTRLKRKNGKIVGRLTMYSSTKATMPVIPKRGSYYASHLPKTATGAAVILFKETGNPREYEPLKTFGTTKYGKPSLLKAATARKLHLVDW